MVGLVRLNGSMEKHPVQTKLRRYRFLMEVGGLSCYGRNGVPCVLEANEDEWKQDGVELYLVMEFIEGLTMAELVQKAPPNIDNVN